MTGKIISLSWRNKQEAAWHNSFAVTIKGEMHDKKTYYNSSRFNGDIFYKFFLGNMCLNKSCYSSCKYKQLASYADIRIGDLWGTKYSSNEEGVTGLITFTDNGENILRDLVSCTIIEESLDIITEGQQKERIKKPYYYLFLNKLFTTPLSLTLLYKLVQLLRIGKLIKNKIKMAKQ
jgi:hypothetical protein